MSSKTLILTINIEDNVSFWLGGEIVDISCLAVLLLRLKKKKKM